MTIKILLIIILALEAVLAVIYREQPPQAKQNTNQPKSAQQSNLVRRRFKNEVGVEPLPVDFCFKFDFKNQLCTQCFEGFFLKNNACNFNPNFNPKNKWNDLSFIKISSPSKPADLPGVSTPHRNPFCSSATSDGVLCLSCHQGFDLIDGDCIQKDQNLTLGQQLFLRPLEAPKNTFCHTFNEKGECVKCFPRFTYNGTDCVIIPKPEYDCRLHQNCMPKSTQCQTYSAEGLCKSCPKQSININGICRVNKVQSLCQELGKRGKCKKCSEFATNFDGVCKFRTPHCLQYNADNTCDVCLVTYRRINGQCIRPSKIMFVNSDPMCATWKQGVCIQCQYGFGFYQGYCMDLKQIQAAGFTPQISPIQLQN